MKRPRGMGHIYRRGKIFWISYWRDGAKHRETSHSDDKKVANALLHRRLGEIAMGQHTSAGPVTLGQVIDLVIEDYRFRGLKDLKTVMWRATAHFGEAFRKQSAAKFGTADIRDYVQGRRADGAENATINRELSILRHGYTLAQRADPPLVHRAPHIPILEEDNARQGFLEPEQYERLLEELPERLKAWFVCAYHVGTRKGELRQVRWEQVDFEAGMIRLEKGQTKGKAPRTLPIYGDMERWLRTQQETSAPNCPYVFHSKGGMIGKHMDGWHEACERAGLAGLLPHDLRRSAIRNMKRAGIPDSIAMKISGHKTSSIFRRYDIVDEADLDDAGEKLEQYFERRKQQRAAKLERVK